MRALIIAVIVMVSCCACASRSQHWAQSVPQGLGGVTWTYPAADTTAVFRPGSIHLSDGCSGVTYHLSVRGDLMRMGRQFGDGYACGGVGYVPGTAAYAVERHRVVAEDRLDRMLSHGVRWTVRGSVLTLTGTTGRTVLLTSRGGAPLTLAGSRWTLEFIDTVHGAGGSLRGPTLQFGRDGTFRATNSCDELTGTAAIGKRSVSFHVRAHSERRFCPHERLKGTVATLDTMLDTTVDYQIEHNTLRLRDRQNQEGVLTYSPV